MANYITRPAIDRKAGKTDIEQLMPYLKNELETVRNNDNAKIAALTEIEGEAMANPEAYRGTKFHIDSSGFTNMNEKAKSLMRPKDGIDYSQDAINESSDVINRELTDQLTTDAINKIANTEERRTTAADAKNIGQLDKARLAQLALDGKDSQGNDLLKDIATPTPPATQPTEGSIATTQPSSTGSTLTAEQIAANNAEQSDPNFTGPTLTAEQIAANNPTPPDPLKTGTAAEKANALAQANPGMGAAAKDANSKSESNSQGRDWTVTTDIGVGKSNIKTDAVHDIKTTTRQGIIDQDAVDLKSLKVAAGIESIRNRALAGRPGATPITTVADRLQAREAFLTDIQNKRGVVTSTKQTGGNVDAGLGEMNAKFTAKTGVDQRNSTVIRNDNSARLTNPGLGGDVKGPQGGTLSLGDYQLQGTDTGRRTKGGEAILRYDTPLDFNGGYEASAIGRKYKELKGDAVAFVKYLKNEGRANNAFYDNGRKGWVVQKDGEELILHNNGAISGDFSTNTSTTFIGSSNKAKIGADGGNISGRKKTTEEAGPDGQKKKIEGVV